MRGCHDESSSMIGPRGEGHSRDGSWGGEEWMRDWREEGEGMTPACDPRVSLSHRSEGASGAVSRRTTASGTQQRQQQHSFLSRLLPPSCCCLLVLCFALLARVARSHACCCCAPAPVTATPTKRRRRRRPRASGARERERDPLLQQPLFLLLSTHLPVGLIATAVDVSHTL